MNTKKIQYHDNEEIYREYYINENGELNSTFIEYNEEGIITQKAFYINGTIDGICTHYYDNGNLMYETMYDNGKILFEKSYHYQHPNSVEKITTYDINENKNGIETYYHENGLISQELNWKNGKLNGEHIFYSNSKQNEEQYIIKKEIYENGNKKSKFEYNRNKLVSKVIYLTKNQYEIFEYDEDEKINQYSQWKNNKIFKEKYYYQNGNVYQTIEFDVNYQKIVKSYQDGEYELIQLKKDLKNKKENIEILNTNKQQETINFGY